MLGFDFCIDPSEWGFLRKRNVIYCNIILKKAPRFTGLPWTKWDDPSKSGQALVATMALFCSKFVSPFLGVPATQSPLAFKRRTASHSQTLRSFYLEFTLNTR